MRITWLAWYICGVCLILVLLTSMITWHPDAQHWAGIVPAVLGSAGLLAGGAAVGLGRLPLTHPLQRSKPMWAGFVAIAITVILLLIFVG